MRPSHGNFVYFRVGSSNMNKKWLVIIHVSALAASLIAFPPMEIRLLSVVLIGLSFIFNVKRYTRYKAFLRFRSKEGWLYSSTGKSYQLINILDGTVCTPFFIIINFRNRQHRRYILVWFDAMDKDSFRRLAVFLKLYGQ